MGQMFTQQFPLSLKSDWEDPVAINLLAHAINACLKSPLQVQLIWCLIANARRHFRIRNRNAPKTRVYRGQPEGDTDVEDEVAEEEEREEDVSEEFAS